MISFLRGTIASKGVQGVVLEVNGVGFAVTMPSRAMGQLGSVGEEALVYTAMQVKEDGISLFGFVSEDERFIYEKLITVSGIGPKMAISALSLYSADELVAAIASGDVSALSKVSGLGKKTAQRIIVDLKGSFEAMGAGEASQGTPATRAEASEAVAALLSMGFSYEESQLAVSGYAGSADVQELIRYALKRLGGM